MEGYDHKTIEEKWQKAWTEAGIYNTPNSVEGKENEYVMVEFPYPSGDLHVGHWYAFAVSDIYARYQRLQGKNVLFPIGFDAFGLPAENAAIKHGLNPREWTYKNMDTMREQLKSMGASFDWSREIASCSPEYYKWTQWFFLKLLEAGLIEKKVSLVNWDPVDKTVLANEQVLADGTAERSGALVEKKEMEQWTVKITKYADRLIDDLDDLDWPNQIKESQKNWIGRSKGAEVDFNVEDFEEKIKVFTTRPDTLFGVTYIVLAPEHKLVEKLISKVSNKKDVEDYIEKTKRKLERERLIGVSEKTGVVLDGVFAINPANNEKVPVYIADYVLAGYGTGAVMAVPAHDERDFEFAEKFSLPIKKVIIPRFVDHENPHVEGKEIVFRKGILAIVKNPKNEKFLLLNWKKQRWTTFICGGIEKGETPEEAAAREIIEETGYKNLKFIKKVCGPIQTEFFAAHKDLNRVAHSWVLLFELEDEVHDEISDEESQKHSLEWVDFSYINENKLRHTEISLILESLKNNSEKAYTGAGVLINSGEFDGLQNEDAKEKITLKVGGQITSKYKLRDWVVSRQRYWGCPIPIINCKSCGAVPVSDENLPVILPDISDYLPRDDGKSPLAKATEWVNVKCPKCGNDAERETDTLDTFVDSSWYYLRYLDSKNSEKFAEEENLKNWMPVDFYSGGSEHTTMHLLFARFFNKALYDLKLSPVSEPFKYRLNRGLILGTDGNKMSKSKGNVINPDTEVERFGADTVRTYLAFIGPYNEPGNYPWDQNGIVGARRFLERIFKIDEKLSDNTPEAVKKTLHKAIKKVSEDMKKLKFNTAISELMILTNEIYKNGISKEDAKIVSQLLAPIAPHAAEELWEKLGGKNSVHLSMWPIFDESIIVENSFEIPVQVNGKIRAKILVSVDQNEDEIKDLALKDESVMKWLGESQIKNYIYIPKKLISIVI